jgi:hypothetical protein
MNSVKEGLCALLLVGVVFVNKTAQAASGVPQVYSGPTSYSSFLVDGAGWMSGWGENGYGSLGIGGYSDQPMPVLIPFPSGVHAWKAAAAREGWTYAIGDDSQLYAAGCPFVGAAQLYLAPLPSGAGGGGVSEISAGEPGWLAVSTDGSIYGMVNGSVSWPALPGAERWLHVAVCYFYVPYQPDLFAIDDRGRMYGVEQSTAWFFLPPFVEIPIPAGATAWRTVTGGGRFVLATADDGNLYTWGHNESGQLGVGTRFAYTNVPQRVALPAGKTAWKAFAAGETHALATTSDGQLFSWGYNGYGQLGLGDNGPNQLRPIAVPNLTNVAAIAAGARHSLAIVDCRVLAWGGNSCGQLGAGFTSVFYPMPIQANIPSDCCATTPPLSPVVSVSASDRSASEGTWLSTLGQPATNTGQLIISRVVTTGSSLEVKLSVQGTAGSGVDYLELPASVTIPANSNSVSLQVVPTGSTLFADPSTVVIDLLPDPAYQLASPASATVTLTQYEHPTGAFMPYLTFNLFVGTNLNGRAFVVQASTNLTDWATLATATNFWGIVTITETNFSRFGRRFYRAFPF